MKIEDILKLVNAGYNRSEIDAMLGAVPEPAAVTPKEPEISPAPVEVEQPAIIEQATGTEIDPTQKAISDLTAQITRLTTIVQRSNMLAAEQPDLKPVQADDIIASIIYPTYKADK